jgi:hypothetical protein
MQLRRLVVTTLAAVAAASSLAACGGSEAEHAALTEGDYVTTGDLKYQVQISRVLNPGDFEDRDYLTGIAAYDKALGTNNQWFGIFLRAFNKTDVPHRSAKDMEIVDTTGKVFTPVRIDPNVNRTAYRPVVVMGGDQIPVPGSLARENATQGGLVLFKIPVDAFANRPLELRIKSPVGGPEATVDLDI